MANVKTIRDLWPPTFWRTWDDMHHKRVGTVCCSGGRGCVSGDTRLVTPKGLVCVRDFCGGDILSLTERGVCFVPACSPIKYFRVKLYRVILQNGASLDCTDQHRFLTPSGWRRLDELSEGDAVCLSSLQSSSAESVGFSSSPEIRQTSSYCLQASHCEERPQGSPEDDLHLMRRLLGLIYHYWNDRHQCDGLLLAEEDTYLDVLLRLAGVSEHTQGNLHEGGLAYGPLCTLWDQHGFRLSRQDCLFPCEGRYCEGGGIQNAKTPSELLSACVREVERCLVNGDLGDSMRQVARLLLCSISYWGLTAYDLVGTCPCASNDMFLGAGTLQKPFDMLGGRVADESYSDSLSNEVVASRGRLLHIAIKKIEFKREDFFYDLFVPFYNNYISEGGMINHNSCKSTFCTDAIVLRLEMARAEALRHRAAGEKDWKRHLTHAACFRKVAGTLPDSCFAQFQWSVNRLGLADKYVFRKSPLSIMRKNTNQRIYFRGLDDPLKARSLKAPFSYIRDLWYEEVSEFDNIEEIQDVTRSVQRGGHEFMTFYSYNPPETSANWVNYAMAELDSHDPTFKIYKSDYRTVPREWLGEKFFRDAAILYTINERAYRHIYLGEITGNGGTVFPNVKRVSLSAEDIRKFDNVKWGADFGLRDPTVLVGLQYDPGVNKITIFKEWYRSDATLDEVEYNFNRLHGKSVDYIIGDAAAGQLILTLRKRGMQILPSEKGAGSILNGIKGLQSLVAIEIDPVRCPNTYREFVNYEYEKNKMGQFTGRLPDFDNHSIDAVRYATERVFGGGGAFN